MKMANARTTDNLGLVLPGDDSTNTPWGASIEALSQAFIRFDIASSDHPLAVERRKLGLIPLTDTGKANAYALAIDPAPKLERGSKLAFRTAQPNTGPATVAINGGEPIAITKDGVAPLVGGEIPAGALTYLVYNGTGFQTDLLRRDLGATGVYPEDVSLISKGGPETKGGPVDTGVANAYVVSTSPEFKLEAGGRVAFLAAHTNTGPSTLIFNSGTAADIVKSVPKDNGSALEELTGGEIVAGEVVHLQSDGGRFHLEG
jgi:hypothetical protein